MDTGPIVSGFGSFMMFLFLQVIFFRYLDSTKPMKWLLWFFGLVTGLQTLFIYTWGIESVIVSFLIYGSLAFLYVTAIFGIAVTSVRIQLLDLIHKRGNRGITYKQILSIYNRDTIIATRLKRLVGSGELVEDKDVYRLATNKSPFAFYSRIAWFIKKIYGA